MENTRTRLLEDLQYFYDGLIRCEGINNEKEQIRNRISACEQDISRNQSIIQNTEADIKRSNSVLDEAKRSLRNGAASDSGNVKVGGTSILTILITIAMIIGGTYVLDVFIVEPILKSVNRALYDQISDTTGLMFLALILMGVVMYLLSRLIVAPIKAKNKRDRVAEIESARRQDYQNRLNNISGLESSIAANKESIANTHQVIRDDQSSIEPLQAELVQQDSRLTSAFSEIAEYYNTFAPDYRYPYAVGRMINYLRNGRVDTMKEAINLYETELYQDSVKNELRGQTAGIQQLGAALNQANRTLDGIRYDTSRTLAASERAATAAEAAAAASEQTARNTERIAEDTASIASDVSSMAADVHNLRQRNEIAFIESHPWWRA